MTKDREAMSGVDAAWLHMEQHDNFMMIGELMGVVAYQALVSHSDKLAAYFSEQFEALAKLALGER